MGVVVAIPVIALVGAGWFLTKEVFKAMVEVWRKPPQLGSRPIASSDWVSDRKAAQDDFKSVLCP